MLWVKKCNLSGGKYFPIKVNIFPHAENLELLFFCYTAFVGKIIRENIIRYFRGPFPILANISPC